MSRGSSTFRTISEAVFAIAVEENDHLQNRTSVEIYFNTGTVLEMTRFTCKPNEFHLLFGPETQISSGNVYPNAKIRRWEVTFEVVKCQGEATGLYNEWNKKI